MRIVFLFFGKKEIIMIKKRKETSFIHGWNEVVGAIRRPRIFSSSMIYRNSRKLAKRQASGVSGIRGLSPTPNTLSRKNG